MRYHETFDFSHLAHVFVCSGLKLEVFVNSDSFLLLEYCGWAKEDLEVFRQPCVAWEGRSKFAQFLDTVGNLSFSTTV